MKEILLNIESKEIRLAKIEEKKLQELVIERKKTRQLTGNVYRGRVTNILHNIQSAFIDIGEGENGFIHISDILENTQKFQELFDMDFDWDYDLSTHDQTKKNETDISKILKIDETVLVQVVKEPIGTKGARLTSNISVPGRYLVLLPNNPHRGVSRKIATGGARDKLKQIIRSFEMPSDMGLICRTASMLASTEQLVEEAHELLEAWNKIVENFHKSTGPTCLYRESDIIKRAVMTALDKKYDRILIDHHPTYLICNKIASRYKEADQNLKVEFYRDKTPMFKRFNVEKEIEKALTRKIWLPSGGYLYFEKTEAMHTVDVNSGRSHSSLSGNVEEALVHINMEAADEIARQLRIRNVGGLIVCDFIDMRSRKNQRRVLDRLKEAMKEDSAKCTILGMSEFGLVEMTRQRNRESLAQTLFIDCPYCSGKGMIKSHESVSIEIERDLRLLLLQEEHYAFEIVSHPLLNHYLEECDKKHLVKMMSKSNATLSFRTNEMLHMNDFEIYSMTNGKKLEI